MLRLPEIPGFNMRNIMSTTKQTAWVTKRALATMLIGKDATDTLLQQLKMPVLIAWGAVDRISPLDLGEKIQRLDP